jgi:hypothetical protein
MSKHTPGPWHAGTDEDAHMIYDASCNVVGESWREFGEEEAEKANAILMAAAPDLLAALKELLAAASDEAVGMASEMAQTAIAKAEGQL